MKRGLLIGIALAMVFLIAIISAYTFKTTYNPFTGKSDYFQTENFTGYNITANYFIGDGSLLTNISGGAIYLNLSGTNANQNINIGIYNLTTIGLINSSVFYAQNYMDFFGLGTNVPAPSTGINRIHALQFHGFTRLETDNEASTNVVISRDNVFIARNNLATTISKGQAVYVSGATGNVPNIGLAIANQTSTLPAVGVALDSITAGSFGQVMKLGVIENFDTSMFSVGDQIYVNITNPGSLTNVRPPYPNYVQRIGSVLVSGVGNGAMLITTAPFVGGIEGGTTNTDYTFAGNVTAIGNITANEFEGKLNWTFLQNYPVPCPADTFVTQINDTITCTAISDVYLLNSGDTATGNYTFDSGTFFIDSTNNRTGIGTTSPKAQLTLGATTQNGLRIVSTSGFYPIEVWNTPETTVLFRVDPVTGAVYGAGAISTATGIRVTAFGAYMGVLNANRFIFNGNNIQVMNSSNKEIARFADTGLLIGGTVSGYNLSVGNISNTNYGIISAFFEGNITSAGYITRTEVYDKSKGNALDFIRDADSYLTNGKIDDSKFYGYVTWNTTMPDYSKPVFVNQTVCDDICTNKTIIDYPYKIQLQNKGVSLDAQVSLHSQALYELKLENSQLKASLCKLGAIEWC